MAVNYTKMTSKGGGQPFQRLETASKNPVFIDLEEKKPKNNIPSSGNSNNRGKSTSFENTTPKSNDYYKSTFSPAGRIKETFTSVSNNSSNTSMNTPAVNDRLKLGHGPISDSKYYEMKAQQNRQNNSFGAEFNMPKREEKFLPAYEPKKAEYSFPVRKEDYLKSIRKNNKPGSGNEFPYSKKDYLRLAQERVNNPKENIYAKSQKNYTQLRDDVDAGIFEMYMDEKTLSFIDRYNNFLRQATGEKETKKIGATLDNIQNLNVTPMDAARISAHIYGAVVPRNDTGLKAYMDGETVAGSTWKKVGGEYGNVTMKVGVYTRERLEGEPEEYVVSFMGTKNDFSGVYEGLQTVGTWANNIFQNFTPLSADMWEAIIYAQQFVKAHPDAKITFVGHSKGGAEALMAAVATDKDAVVFNPAQPNFRDYSLNPKYYTGRAVSYIMRGETINEIFGEPGVGEVRYVGEYNIPWKINDGVSSFDISLEEHEIEKIINYFRKGGVQ